MIYEMKEVCFRYPNAERLILDHVSLSLACGEILAILGPNGAGKSTLLNCLAGLQYPAKGQILLAGKSMDKMSRYEVAQLVGYVQQTHNPTFSYTVFEYVMMGRAPKVGFFARPQKQDENIVWDTLDVLGITHLANRPYTQLSGGERQQCAIAHAIVQQPQVVLFDEPTSSLDYGNQVRILRLLKTMVERGYAVVMTTHNPDHALLLSDKTAIINKRGQLEYGSTKELITQTKLQEIYNADVCLLYVDALEREVCLQTKL